MNPQVAGYRARWWCLGITPRQLPLSIPHPSPFTPHPSPSPLPQGADETYKSLLALAASLAEQYRARLAGEVAALEAAAMAPSATPATSPTPSTTSSLPELAVHAPVFVPRHLEQWVLAEQWELAEQSYPELPLGYQGFGPSYYSHW